MWFVQEAGPCYQWIHQSLLSRRKSNFLCRPFIVGHQAFSPWIQTEAASFFAALPQLGSLLCPSARYSRFMGLGWGHDRSGPCQRPVAAWFAIGAGISLRAPNQWDAISHPCSCNGAWFTHIAECGASKGQDVSWQPTGVASGWPDSRGHGHCHRPQAIKECTALDRQPKCILWDFSEPFGGARIPCRQLPTILSPSWRSHMVLPSHLVPWRNGG